MTNAMTQGLRHEHLIRINDPSDTGRRWLTRTQLWNGLLRTILEPQILDESIDSASVEEIAPGRLRRRIQRGALILADEVEVLDEDALRIVADSAGAFAGSCMTMQIEEPDREILFVRFTYEIYGLPEIRNEEEDNARCSAYRVFDTERIRQVRMYAALSAPTLQ